MSLNGEKARGEESWLQFAAMEVDVQMGGGRLF